MTPPSDPGSLDHLLAAAERAALRGGEVVRAGVGTSEATTKGAGDYVTEVDRSSEQAIGQVLREAAPGIAMLGEEEGWAAGSGAGRYWVVDPLDGTTNFLHRFPAVGVSVALVEDGRPVVGVVHSPFLGETALAVAGGGARRRREGRADEALHVSTRPPERGVIGTGFPFRRKELLERYLRMFEGALRRFEDLRRPGAAALDLAWVAAGVFDGFFELSLSPWDMAAGAVLIREAGGVVSDWDGEPDGYLSTGHILAGSPAVHEVLLELASQGGGG
ncbi:MAG TPA: inositol monophosphatase family protein [Actinomycetota bacterium]|nr:inositol monophosphatase family protein [Actinomycetota bacterium]